MSVQQHQSQTAACRCGAVAFEAVGAPIMSVACYCASCQEAGRQIEQLAGAPPVLDADGATAMVLYRKDRIRCVRGGERLEAHRLKPDSPTRRMVASCCNSAMCLDFTKGHWLSVYGARLTEGAPPVEMRIMTAGRREGVELPGDAPGYAGFSGRFMWRLLSAWAAMGFRVPKVEGAPG
jgi:hypothetical protein